MFRDIVLPFFMCLLLACNYNTTNTVQKPKNLIHNDKMVEILVELQIIEAAATLHYLHPDSVSLQKLQYREQVFSKFEISDTLFVKSLEYYLLHEDKMEKIYNQVAESIQSRQELYK